MPFKHKLSRRLALLRSSAAAALILLVAGCTDGGPLGSDFGVPTGTDSPSSPSQIVGLQASSDNPTVEPEQPTPLRAVAIRADGVRLPVDAEWEALDGGALRDTVIDSKSMTYFSASEPGEYRLVSHDRGKRFRDTTRVTVPRQNSVSLVKLYVIPAAVSLVAGQGQQFFVYGESSAGDSVPVVAHIQDAAGGAASGLHYTAGDTAGSYTLTIKQQGGSLSETASVNIAAKEAAPVTDPVQEPTTETPTTTEPAPYQPPTSTPIEGVTAELPRTYLDTRFVPPTGRTIVVPAGGDLQGAINAAARGDVIELAAGATFSGNFVLPQKSGTGWITIRSATSLPPEGTRITPQAAAGFAKVVTPNSMPAIRTATGGQTSHYRLVGLDVGSTAEMTYAIINLGDYAKTATSVDQLPSHIVLDRMYVHGTPTQGIQRCVTLNSRSSAVIDSWLDDCHMKGFDTQAIISWESPGPFKIVNNHLAGAGENVMFGGADPRFDGVVPSDIEIRRNHFYKPTSWRGVWTVKNVFEIKNAQRVLFEGNVLENNWSDAQTGFAVVLKSSNQSGSCNWCVAQDLTFRWNVIRNSPGGFNMMDSQNPNGGTSIPAQRITIVHNLLENVAQQEAGSRRLFQLLGALRDVLIAHNTAFTDDKAVMFDGTPTIRLVLRDNIFSRGQYGFFGSGHGEGAGAIAHYAPDGVVAGNIVIAAPADRYPASNFYPSGSLEVGMVNPVNGDVSLSDQSQFSGVATDGTDPGVDYSTLQEKVSGVR